MLKEFRKCAIFAVLIAGAIALHARVVKVEVLNRADVLDGRSFGDAGSYERITLPSSILPMP
jgi:hypothetical protein